MQFKFCRCFDIFSAFKALGTIDNFMNIVFHIFLLCENLVVILNKLLRFKDLYQECDCSILIFKLKV